MRIRIAAKLARTDYLYPLYAIAERQRVVSCNRLLRELDNIADRMKSDGWALRHSERTTSREGEQR
jgi:hypothetical protein